MTIVVALLISSVYGMISHGMLVVWPTNLSLSCLFEDNDLRWKFSINKINENLFLLNTVYIRTGSDTSICLLMNKTLSRFSCLEGSWKFMQRNNRHEVIFTGDLKLKYSTMQYIQGLRFIQ